MVFNSEREKTNRQCPLNHFHSLLRCRSILTVISCCTLRQRQKSETLVGAQRVGAYAGEMSQLSRMHGVSLREMSLNAGTNSRVKSKLIVISTQRLPERTAIALLGSVAGAFALELSWTALRSAHNQHFSRKTHPTVSRILTERFNRVTPYFHQPFARKRADLFP